jgi:hypothetical protein
MLMDERKMLLDAHDAGVVPVDLRKSEQDRIATAVAAIEGRQAEIADDFKTAETNLQRALTRAGGLRGCLPRSIEQLPRQFNPGFFERLVIGDG